MILMILICAGDIVQTRVLGQHITRIKISVASMGVLRIYSDSPVFSANETVPQKLQQCVFEVQVIPPSLAPGFHAKAVLNRRVKQPQNPRVVNLFSTDPIRYGICSPCGVHSTRRPYAHAMVPGTRSHQDDALVNTKNGGSLVASTQRVAEILLGAAAPEGSVQRIAFQFEKGWESEAPGYWCPAYDGLSTPRSRKCRVADTIIHLAVFTIFPIARTSCKPSRGLQGQCIQNDRYLPVTVRETQAPPTLSATAFPGSIGVESMQT
ncbi:hypothetical protein JVT61DRAFT_8836 [Boletus reticuloceps]|uniref:Uncharacterized protein n=1 Tax=Boletus reticuloceps TaxID=495285 RepID=A0A8I3A647_9AGAM|nr:hypothetical protein JVT61DRAFT_8836 [Boletus reticuloceps]